MNDDQVRQVDSLAETALGGSSSQSDRQNATAQLEALKTLDNIPALKYVLERTQSSYSRFVCSSTILKVVTDNWNAFVALPGQQHAELRSWLVSYIGQQGHTLENFVRTSVMSVLCRVTKLGWLENEGFRELPKEVRQYFIFGNSSPQHFTIGLMLLNQLVVEVNTLCSKMTLQNHRKTVVSFRDDCLFEIFKIALSALEETAKGNADPGKTEWGVNLALSCLTFDFIGIFADESTDDTGAVQIPTYWKPLLLEGNTVQLFWKLYELLPPPHSTSILKCMVQFASVRRSLFTHDAERKKWLESLLDGILGVLRQSIGLSDASNYHEFCRLLSKIKPNYQLTELAAAQNYQELMELMARFTVESFVNWKQTANSSYFLLSVWSRFLGSQPYYKSDKPSLLDNYGPEVTRRYIMSRLEIAAACIEMPGKVENALEDEDMLLVQLEHFPIIARSLYDTIGPFLMECAMPEYHRMKEFLDKGVPPHEHQQAFITIQILDSRLSWLVYIMGSIINYHSSLSSDYGSEQEQDASLTSLVLELSKLVMRRLSIPGQAAMPTLQRLQSGILYFLNGFRKVYMSEAASCKLYPKLNDLIGIKDMKGVLTAFIEIILNIMKHWKECPRLLKETLRLFLELSTSNMTATKLLQLDNIKALITQPRQFNFMESAGNYKERSRFYRALTCLFFRETSNETAFDSYMKPLRDMAQQLDQLQITQYQQPDVKHAIIGWLRDLRGVCAACENKRTYGIFFDWLFPFFSNHGSQNSTPPLMIRICQVFCADNDVAIPLLRFYNDFVHSHASRICFEPSSYNGILLFRETSTLLKTYGVPKMVEVCPQAQASGGWVVRQSTSAEDATAYEKQYKGITICMEMLHRALQGSYCNFGVFKLYQDPALNGALEIVLKLMLTIPSDDVLAFPKVSKAFYCLLEELFQSHTQSLLQLPAQQFVLVLQHLEKAINSVQITRQLVVKATGALGHLCSFYFHQMQKASAAANPNAGAARRHVQVLQSHLQGDPGLFQRVIGRLFHLLIFDDTPQWTLSKNMFPIVLIHESAVQEYKQSILARVTDSARQERLVAAFGNLMSGVQTTTLETTNCDLFTKNLTSFIHIVKRLV